MPLRDEQSGELIGAIGIVLFDHPETTLQPLISKFAHLQRDLDDARRELASQRRTKYTLASFVGGSPAAVEVKRQARRAALSSSPVLLLGETGTGKELLAHAIHAASARASGPLVSVNIAAVPDTLLEAEFFGVAPGAYTGADRKGRDGKFKLADGGTLFLDEIGDMPPSLQPKLLRALQEGEIEPLGSNKVIAFDARVIAATSRDLAALVREGKFREDLYYRLNVLPIRVPPLRERRRRHPGAGRGARRRTWRCAAARRRRSSAPTPSRCCRPRAGAATSASCATCWSRRRCAAIHSTSRCSISRKCCANPASRRLPRPSLPLPRRWPGRRPGCCARWPSRWPNWSGRP